MITTNLWIAIAAILAVALIIIWWPYFRNTKLQVSEVNNRSVANKQSYQHSLDKLSLQLEEQRINEEEYDSLKTELARKLIQDEATQEQQLSVGKRTIIWPVLASLLTVGLTIPMYLKLGNSEQLKIAANTKQQPAQSQEQQIATVIKNMEEGVAKDPANTQLLFQLAHTYISVGNFSKAINAFDTLIGSEGEHAEFIGPKAQAMYYQNQQQMNEEIKALTDRALELDPQNSATLILLGMDSFVTSNYSQAIVFWQQVLNSKRPGVDTAAIESALEEAKSRLALTGEAMPELPKAPVSGASIKLNVSVSESLVGKYNNDQTVFVYAVPAQGPRMPLAAMKLTVGELPIEIVLNDTMAMTPAAKLSNHEIVQLFAVISQSGSAGINPGDLRGLISSADVNAEDTYQLIIDTVIE